MVLHIPARMLKGLRSTKYVLLEDVWSTILILQNEIAFNV